MSAINNGAGGSAKRADVSSILVGLASNVSFRRLLSQFVVAIVLIAGLIWLASNLRHNLAVRNISSGFGFLGREAGMPIAEHLISYTPADIYLRALIVGTLNTLWVAAWGIAFATVLGVAIGIARLSRNWLLARCASIYVEMFRDIPLLLQLFVWYSILQTLPPVRRALHPGGGVVLSNRGLSFPIPHWHTAHSLILLLLIAGLVVTVVYFRVASRKRLDDGRDRPVWPMALASVVVLPVVLAFVLQPTLTINVPEAQGFNIRGGMTVSPEFFALLVGLVIYNAAFIAEIVRSGIQSVGHGQHEAARALGLHSGNTLQWIVFPQALRVIVPPLTSQYLNLTKGSALAVAIGYQDIVSIATTAMNQTGQAIELVAVIMGVYLTISLSISVVMNIYNANVSFVER